MVATAAIFAAGVVITVGGSAGAAPTQSVAQVQAKLSKLESEVERLDQQYDQVKEQLAATDQRLTLVNKQLASFNTAFSAKRTQITRIAVTAYEDGNVTSTITLLTSGNPQQILNQSSILLELSANDNAQIVQFLSAARQLTNAQQVVGRTRMGILQLRGNLGKRRAAMQKLVNQEQALLNSLTPAQQAAVGPSGGTTHAKYGGPTKTQAEKAVAFAYARLGCPYVYGGTGPCSSGYDCSGLTMSAWGYAGVSIPRTSYDQWASLPHVSESSMQPGDIMVFNGGGHVGIYVGNGKLIDAPHTGLDVELVSFSGWFASTFDGAVRP
jgi:cell wall-associated NlpC family hydrolase